MLNGLQETRRVKSERRLVGCTKARTAAMSERGRISPDQNADSHPHSRLAVQTFSPYTFDGDGRPSMSSMIRKYSRLHKVLAETLQTINPRSLQHEYTVLVPAT